MFRSLTVAESFDKYGKGRIINKGIKEDSKEIYAGALGLAQSSPNLDTAHSKLVFNILIILIKKKIP